MWIVLILDRLVDVKMRLGGVLEGKGGGLRVVVSSKQASGGRVYSNIVDIKYVFLIFKFTHFRNAFLKCYAYHKI